MATLNTKTNATWEISVKYSNITILVAQHTKLYMGHCHKKSNPLCHATHKLHKKIKIQNIAQVSTSVLHSSIKNDWFTPPVQSKSACNNDKGAENIIF